MPIGILQDSCTNGNKIPVAIVTDSYRNHATFVCQWESCKLYVEILPDSFRNPTLISEKQS